MNYHRLLAGVATLLLAFSLFSLIPAVSYAQNDQYVGRYDAFGGFSYMASPKMNLYQRGFNGEFGINVRRWLALGVDYSILDGRSAILPRELDPAVLQQLAPYLGKLPTGYQLQVPFEARSQTFSAGPQINIRKWRPVMFFVRPALGALHERVTLKPADPIQTAVVSALLPSMKTSDTVVFYGVGGGFDVHMGDHMAIRVGVDYVHMFLFEGLLAEGRNSVRLSIGPTVRWGKNVEK